MSQLLNERAIEGSTYSIDEIQFLDEEGVSVIPKEDMSWVLEDKDGTEIATGTVTASESMTITLSGDQLDVTEDEKITTNARYVCKVPVYVVCRVCKVSGIIDSTLGNDLPVNESFIFSLESQ